jgi:prevent-host-death family protein
MKESSMSTAISAADANRAFSGLLRRARDGETVVITSHGKPVARIVPVRDQDRVRDAARRALFNRLRAAPVGTVRRWTREELYEG